MRRKPKTKNKKVSFLQVLQNDTPHDTIHHSLSLSHSFLLFSNRIGLASAAMACKEWKVDPIRSHSFVPILGVRGCCCVWWWWFWRGFCCWLIEEDEDDDVTNGRCKINPPDLLTMNKCKKTMMVLDAGRTKEKKCRTKEGARCS